MNKKIIIVGFGDTGKRVLARLNQNKSTIFISKHQTALQLSTETRAIKIINIDLDKNEGLTDLPTKNAYIFYFAPPPATGTKDKRMLNFTQALKKQEAPKRIVYISTTGVYGDCQGEWVTETSELKPNNARSKRRLHAESLLQAFCTNTITNYVILRVSGIYCLEKLPLERLRKGIKILHPSLAPPSNRIHADDLANICMNGMFSGPANEIFNLSDGNPSSISDYFIQISNKFGLTSPERLNWAQAEKTLSPTMLSYLHESKKICHQKALKQLKAELKYPTLMDGLQQCHELMLKKI